MRYELNLPLQSPPPIKGPKKEKMNQLNSAKLSVKSEAEETESSYQSEKQTKKVKSEPKKPKRPKLQPIITTEIMTQRKQCPSCPLSFIRTEHLVRHSYVHSGIKPFQCSICNRGFSRLDALQRHSKTHSTPVKQQKRPLSPKITPELIDSKIPLSPEVEGILECASSLVKMASRKTIAIENLIN
ncbi:hypothetical protein HDV06_004051 [Boothiomyces sp. JEL0866]|nr:hypothetical protein HDV06_004051 [Boothiomyces sp. JEL0866]